MPHTRQTQGLEVQSLSIPAATLHPQHPHASHIRPKSLSLSLLLTMSAIATFLTHHNNTHTLSLTFKSKGDQVCATPGRRKCLKSRVCQSLLQRCIQNINTHLTSDHNHTHTHTLSLSLSLSHTQGQSIAALLTHT